VFAFSFLRSGYIWCLLFRSSIYLWSLHRTCILFSSSGWLVPRLPCLLPSVAVPSVLSLSFRVAVHCVFLVSTAFGCKTHCVRALPRSPTLQSLCTLWTQPPPSHAAPASRRDFFFLMLTFYRSLFRFNTGGRLNVGPVRMILVDVSSEICIAHIAFEAGGTDKWLYLGSRHSHFGCGSIGGDQNVVEDLCSVVKTILCSV
jgi:hypothetical protein